MITIRISLINRDSRKSSLLYRNTVLVINRRDYSQAEVEDWASCGDDPLNRGMIKLTILLLLLIGNLKSSVFHPLHLRAICIQCLFIRIFRAKVLLHYC